MPNFKSDLVEATSTIAVVVASNEPLLFLSADRKVIAASTSFCQAFDVDPATVFGKDLNQLGSGEWAIPQLASLLSATASGISMCPPYEIQLKRANRETRHLVLNVRPLTDGRTDQVRLLLAITDVTSIRSEARQKDDLIREKAILVQEVQHRVANSLQIIASVLMQSARRVQSEEARGYLQNAHHRVMSIAAVQKLLSVSEEDQISLGPYLSQLCASLGASMIADPDRLSISVSVDGSVVEAGVSISLGLMVTELVINALKHAFPDQPKGTITVVYRSEGKDWTLSVTDDGIGMPTGVAAPKAGLGTGIVEALARNLRSEIVLADAAPGTSITIQHRAAAWPANDLAPAA
jgi:two-component sensor histidine kinase